MAHAYLRVTSQDKGGYNARALDFDDHAVLVAEADAEASKGGRIVGVINVGIKPVCTGGTTCNVGFLYGLRVHQGVQGAGLGQRLMALAEQRAALKGCSRMLLTVNDDNQKARRFFAKSGYVEASRRVLQFSLLLSQAPPPPLTERVEVLSLTDPRASAHFKSVHEGREMTPKIDTLLACKPCLGFLSAVSLDGSSRAGALMWDSRYAHVSSRMLTFADMLTYADV